MRQAKKPGASSSADIAPPSSQPDRFSRLDQSPTRRIPLLTGDATLVDRLRAVARRVEVPVAVLWLVLAGCLAVATTRVVDWFVMTDELLYERLALSIAQTGSPLPRVHGVLISNINQLYPLLIAPLFSHGLVPSSLRAAHALNAFVMSSAAVPAFLLTWRLTRQRWLSYLIAALTICVPWIVLSSLLLTEVVAYPAFLWAVLALQYTLESRGRRADLIALLGITVAVLARTQFAAFLIVLPIALFIHELRFAEREAKPWGARVRRAATRSVSEHRLLAGVYVAMVAAAVALAAAGRLSSVLGTYSSAARGNVVPQGIGRALLDHVGTIALGAALLPFLVGVAWLLSTIVKPSSRERHAFASIASIAILALVFEVSSFDERFGGATVHDRYLFYVVPLFLIAFAAALSERSWPRWSLLISTVLLVAAFVHVPLPRFEKLNVDTPAAAIDDGLVRFAGSTHAARLLLALGTVVIAVLIVQASVLLRRRVLVALLVALTLMALPAETGYAFAKLFATNGTSGRPITLAQSSFFAWIDKAVGRDASVTMIPYPLLLQDYGSNVGYWWDVEFWNAAVDRDAIHSSAYSWTPSTFPKQSLRFDPTTGHANLSPSDYVVQAVADARFHIAAASTVLNFRGAWLVRAAEPWRADWLTSGLFEDGWTRPGVVAKIKVFAEPGQTTPLRRYVTLGVHAPASTQHAAIDVSSNADHWHEDPLDIDTIHQVAVCVPPKGFAEISITSPARSVIYGDPTTVASYGKAARIAGLLLTQIALADETSPC
jgi:hypothetical protein